MLKSVLFALAVLPLASPAWAADAIQLRVEDATVTTDAASGNERLIVKFAEPERTELAEFTQSRVGLTMDISVNDVVLVSPRLLEPIAGGTISVVGGTPDVSWEEMAELLNAKKALVTFTVVD